MTCAQIQAGASQFTCLERQEQLPAVIYLLNQILTNGSGVFASVFSGNYQGNPPPFTPIVMAGTIVGSGVTAAIAFDTSSGELWSYWNNQWQ